MVSIGIAYTGPCIFHGFLIGCDGVTDPVITVFNNTSASGQEVVPTTTFDGSALGLSGVTGQNKLCSIGLYIQITGTVEVVPDFTPWPPIRL